MNIELKHLAPYLPFKLRLKREGYEKKYHMVSSSESAFYSDGVELNKVISDRYEVFKPIFYPLSSLTKEIEHNGGRFVPFDKLFEKNPRINNPIISMQAIGYVFDGQTNWISTVDGSIQKSCSWWIVQKLFEWHFDVFGLIPAGLALDVETLKQEK